MWRLRRFLPPNQEVHHDADNNYQDNPDQNQSMRHTVLYLAVMLHKRGLAGKEDAASQNSIQAPASRAAACRAGRSAASPLGPVTPQSRRSSRGVVQTQRLESQPKGCPNV